MNDQIRQKFINDEIEALYEELDITIKKLELLRPFFEDLLKVIKGEEPSYKFSDKSEEIL